MRLIAATALAAVLIPAAAAADTAPAQAPQPIAGIVANVQTISGMLVRVTFRDGRTVDGIKEPFVLSYGRTIVAYPIGGGQYRFAFPGVGFAVRGPITLLPADPPDTTRVEHDPVDTSAAAPASSGK